MPKSGRVELSVTRAEGDALWLALTVFWQQLQDEGPSADRGVMKRVTARAMDKVETARRVAAGLEKRK